MQEIEGVFKITFWGTIFVAVSKSELANACMDDPEKTSIATVYSLHITPFFAFGFTTWKYKNLI